MSHFLYQRKLHHYETDADGVCHFSNYFRIFEESFAATLAAAYAAPAHLSHSFAVTEAHCNYQLPIRYGDQMEVKFAFSMVRRSFLVAQASIYVDGQMCAELSAKFAAVAKEDNKSIPLNPELREALNQFLIKASIQDDR